MHDPKQNNHYKLHVVEGPAIVCIQGQILAVDEGQKLGIPKDRVVDLSSENSDGQYTNAYMVPRMDWVLDGFPAIDLEDRLEALRG